MWFHFLVWFILKRTEGGGDVAFRGQTPEVRFLAWGSFQVTEVNDIQEIYDKSS